MPILLPIAPSLPAPVTIKGAPNGSNDSESVTIPAHNVGDLIVIFAFIGDSTTPPVKPAAGGTVPAWVDIDHNTGASSCASRTAYFVATANNHTSGTWGSDNYMCMVAVVISGQGSTPIGGHAEASAGAGNGSLTAPSVTLTNTDGTSLLLHFFATHRASVTWNAPPAGYNQLLATGSTTLCAYCLDVKVDSTSDGSVTQTNNETFGNDRAATVEIRQH